VKFYTWFHLTHAQAFDFWLNSYLSSGLGWRCDYCLAPPPTRMRLFSVYPFFPIFSLMLRGERETKNKRKNIRRKKTKNKKQTKQNKTTSHILCFCDLVSVPGVTSFSNSLVNRFNFSSSCCLRCSSASSAFLSCFERKY
jgi:hypothetical protein